MALSSREQDIQMMLAAKCHIGTKNCDYQMQRYIFRRSPADATHIIDLGKTWDKLQLAARIICAIENPQDVVVLSARPYGQRAVLKFAQYTGTKALVGRFTPGTFTNQIQKTFEEPRLLVLTDPRVDHQAIRESAYVNVPTIAFCNADSPLKFVDIAIPANNKGKESIGCLYYLLTKMVLQMRGIVSASNPWDVMVDMFFYREPEETRTEEEEAGAEQAGGFAPAALPAAEEGWAAAEAPAAGQWEAAAAPVGGFAAAAPLTEGFAPATDFAAQY